MSKKPSAPSTEISRRGVPCGRRDEGAAAALREPSCAEARLLERGRVQVSMGRAIAACRRRDRPGLDPQSEPAEANPLQRQHGGRPLYGSSSRPSAPEAPHSNTHHSPPPTNSFAPAIHGNRPAHFEPLPRPAVCPRARRSTNGGVERGACCDPPSAGRGR